MGAAIAAAYGMWGLVTGRSPMEMPRPGPAEPARRRGDPVRRGHRRVLPLGARERRDPPERQYLGPVVAAQLLQHPFRGDGVAGSDSSRLGGAPRPQAGPVPAALAAGTVIAGVYAIRYQFWFAIPAAIVAAEALAFTSGGARTLFGQTTRRVAGAVPLVAAGISAVVLAGTSNATFQRVVPTATVTADSQTMAVHTLLPRPGRLRGRAGPALAASGTGGPDRVRYPVRDLSRSPGSSGWFRFNDGAPGWDAATSGYDLLAISSSRHPELAARIRAAPDWRVGRSDAQGLIASRTRSPAGCG